MQLSTTPYIEGFPIKQNLGLVSAEVIVWANIVKDLFAGLTDFFGGRSGAYESALKRGKSEALKELIQEAEKKRSNSDCWDWYAVWSRWKGSMFLININGTAVKI